MVMMAEQLLENLFMKQNTAPLDYYTQLISTANTFLKGIDSTLQIDVKHIFPETN